MKYLYYEYDLFIYLSIYSFVYITLKEGKLEKLCLWRELREKQICWTNVPIKTQRPCRCPSYSK